jgi:hypothetical protein
MNSPTSSILYPALRLLIVSRLQKSIVSIEFSPSYLTESGSQKPIFNPLIKDGLWIKTTTELGAFLDIPLNQINTGTQLEYVSALAFKLAQFQSLSTFALADQIRVSLDHQDQTVQFDTPPERIWQNFIISISQPGWIHLRLTDLGLAEWLQWTIDAIWTPSKPADPRSAFEAGHYLQSAVTFEVLHTYARCNSLLRLGKSEKLIQFESEQDFNHLSQPIPWLNAEQAFRTQYLPDWDLIQQLSEAMDYLATSAAVASASSEQQAFNHQALKVAHRLSQTFQRFHASCRIWGLDQQKRSLAQVRLGLVLITHKVLQSLIEARLGWKAHLEL